MCPPFLERVPRCTRYRPAAPDAARRNRGAPRHGVVGGSWSNAQRLMRHHRRWTSLQSSPYSSTLHVFFAALPIDNRGAGVFISIGRWPVSVPLPSAGHTNAGCSGNGLCHTSSLARPGSSEPWACGAPSHLTKVRLSPCPCVFRHRNTRSFSVRTFLTEERPTAANAAYASTTRVTFRQAEWGPPVADMGRTMASVGRGSRLDHPCVGRGATEW